MTGVVTAEIKVNQTLMKPEYQVISIDVIKEVNRIPSAQLVLLDGDAAQQIFEISNNGFFEIGQLLEISLYYEGQSSGQDLVFQGLITQHQIQANKHQSLLILELKDAAFKLTRQRQSRIFADQTDSAVIEKIIKAVSGLTVGEVATKSIKHAELVQFACSDWDFLLSRAEANGHWVMVKNGKVSVMPPPPAAEPKRVFKYGLSDIAELEMVADIRHQYGTVRGQVWDDRTQQMSAPVKPSKLQSLSQGNVLSQGSLKPTELAANLGPQQYQLVTGSALDPTEAETWVNAQLLKSRFALLQGRLTVAGFADIQLGDLIELDGVGDRFQGTTPVTGIRHQVNVQGWVTDIQFGQAADWFTERHPVTDVPANGLLPGVNGLQIGLVDDYVDDPEGRLRVRVRLPSLPDDENVIWARLATLDAGLERGVCWRPVPGDEVILGFLNQDPRQAVILGSLYSKQNQPPLPVDADNGQRGLITPEQLSLVFDDQAKSIRLETPGTNRLILIDEEGISICDENNNQIVLNAEGIQLTSDQDISITAKGKVILKGANVDVK